MSRITVIFIFLITLPTLCFGQFVGLGAQYADAKDKGNDFQFAVNLSYPVLTQKNFLNSYIASGIDYTGGSSPVSGLNIKPIQFTSYLSESFFNNNKFTILLGADAGYLINHRHGKDGIVLTPNLYIDYHSFFIKTGYDFNVTGNRQQFFIRVGFGIGMGTIKSFAKTKIR